MLVGIFGAVGREAKGAVRSIGYDLHHSKRFRRLGALAVVTVAGGVVATGALLKGPVPELMGIETDRDGSGVIDGWFGFGSDTLEQDAEPTETSDTLDGGGQTSPEGGRDRTPSTPAAGGAETESPGPEESPSDWNPDLSPVEAPDDDSPEESSPSQSPSESADPDPEPTTTSPSPSPSSSPSETGSPSATASASRLPTASGTPSE